MLTADPQVVLPVIGSRPSSAVPRRSPWCLDMNKKIKSRIWINLTERID